MNVRRRPCLAVLVAVGALGLGGCACRQAPVGATAPGASPSHEKLNAVLWLQQAAEARGLALQTFALARLRLDEALADPALWADAVTRPTPPAGPGFALITDLDETVLDNSEEEAEAVARGLHGFDLPLWRRWVSQARAPALAGAAEFLRYAAGRGVALYYVTNRGAKGEVLRNVAAAGFPAAAEENVLVEGEYLSNGAPSDKEGRRQAVARRCRVLLSLGDDLGDFVSVRGLGCEERAALVEANRERFGRAWVLVPNPVYGSWERVYGTLERKREALRRFEP